MVVKANDPDPLIQTLVPARVARPPNVICEPGMRDVPMLGNATMMRSKDATAKSAAAAVRASECSPAVLLASA
jgi:hypothetical protein